MIACHGRVQREGEVIHVVTDVLEDLSDLLRSVGQRDEAFPIVHGRGDGATHPAGRDPRTGPGSVPEMPVPRDIYVPDLRLGSGIEVATRDSGKPLPGSRFGSFISGRDIEGVGFPPFGSCSDRTRSGESRRSQTSHTGKLLFNAERRRWLSRFQ